jgi:hypothetical protein
VAYTASWLDEEQPFLADIERIKNAHKAWSEAPPDRKPRALLQGLLLSHARDWVVQHPQRLTGRGMEKLRGSTADDAAHARSQRLRRRLVQAFLAATFIFFTASVVTGWLYYRAEGARHDATVQRDQAENARRQATEQETIAKAELATAQLNESRFLTSMAETELRNGDPQVASLIARAALPEDM